VYLPLLSRRAADVSFRIMLGSLRTLNRSMDKLVSTTPTLIRDTLQSAAAAKGAAPPDTATSSGTRQCCMYEPPQAASPVLVQLAAAAIMSVKSAFSA
jgi:hypothetical protein